MNKTTKTEYKYIMVNVNEPCANDVFELIKKNSKEWNEPTDFDDWCMEKFGGQWVMFLSIYGETSMSLQPKFDENGFVIIESIKENCKHIVFEEYCQGEEKLMKENFGLSVNGYDHLFRITMPNKKIRRCEDLVFKTYEKQDAIVMKWLWVDKENFEMEWDGF